MYTVEKNKGETMPSFLYGIFNRWGKLFGGTVLTNKTLFGGTVLPNNMLFGRPVPPNHTLFHGTPDLNKPFLIQCKVLDLNVLNDISSFEGKHFGHVRRAFYTIMGMDIGSFYRTIISNFQATNLCHVILEKHFPQSKKITIHSRETYSLSYD